MKSQTENQKLTPDSVPQIARRMAVRPLDEFEQVRDAMAAIRRFVSSPEEPGKMLAAVREATGADEVFLARARGPKLTVLAAPLRNASKAAPGLAAELQSAGTLIDPAGARRFGGLLGAKSPFLSAGVCSDNSSRIAVVAGWSDGPGLSPESMALLAEMIGAARHAVGQRERDVEKRVQGVRTKWAYEIHDNLTQTVAAAILELEGLRRRIELDPNDALGTISATKAEIRNALADLRGVLFDLQQEDDKEEGAPLAKYIHEVVGKWTLSARVSVDGDLSNLPRNVQSIAHVVLREGLANVAKHSGADSVDVEVQVRVDAVVVQIEDPGRGFDPEESGRAHHFGMRMIRRRIEEAGGTLEVESEPGKGTLVRAIIPVSEARQS